MKRQRWVVCGTPVCLPAVFAVIPNTRGRSGTSFGRPDARAFYGYILRSAHCVFIHPHIQNMTFRNTVQHNKANTGKLPSLYNLWTTQLSNRHPVVGWPRHLDSPRKPKSLLLRNMQPRAHSSYWVPRPLLPLNPVLCWQVLITSPEFVGILKSLYMSAIK